MNDTYRVGIYLRLSREDEKLGESESISTQRDLLMNYIREHNLLFVDEYVDDGVSGTTFHRIGFQRMIRDCENKRINMILTKDTSRLGRDHIDFGYYVERYFPEHHIRYVAVNDGIDTFNDYNSSNDMLVFKSAFNDMYVKDISNKLRSALSVKKKNGLFVGCYAPYGYKKKDDDKYKLIIDRDASLVVKKIFSLFVQGNSISKICDILTNECVPTPSMYKNMRLGQKNVHYGVWSTRTVDSILKNPTYMGNLTQCRNRKINYKSKKRVHTKRDEWIVAEGANEAIVTKEMFTMAQEMFQVNRNRYCKGTGITDSLLLRGLIYCKECQHTIGFRDVVGITKKHGTVHRIYGNCNYWAKRKKERVCTPHSVKYQEIENLILDHLRNIIHRCFQKSDFIAIIDNTRWFNNKVIDIKNLLLQLDSDIDSVNHKIDICYQDKLEGIITTDFYQRTYHYLALELDELNRKKKKYVSILDNINSHKIDYSQYYLNQIYDIINLKKPSRLLISLLIDRIEIDEKKHIDIYYKFS